MYGETVNLSGRTTWRTGLSPHVRGNPVHSLASGRIRRSIPACTGKPAMGRALPGSLEVYPRMYGETGFRFDRLLSLMGLPRMYGETHPTQQHPESAKGLSPHVRGNPPLASRFVHFDGSIPACTGKPCCPPPRHRRVWVYPRMYGETQLQSLRCARQGGLSPHVRGNHPVDAAVAARYRSIPACTGKPSGGARRPSVPGVYPRMYGETCSGTLSQSLRRGLSPHVRGNRHWDNGVDFYLRSIPACTGKPPLPSRSRRAPAVYPRMYGETRSRRCP